MLLNDDDHECDTHDHDISQMYRSNPRLNDVWFSLIYCSSRELQLLRSSDLHILVRAHRQKIRRTYDVVMKNVIQDHQSSVFDNQEFTFDNYAWAMATIDSRSIWWNGRRNLVPVLDLINCQEGPDPDQIHKTEWINDTALTRAPWTVERGDQVWENYGYVCVYAWSIYMFLKK